MTQGKETIEVNYASGSSSDFIMGEFEAVHSDDGCIKKKIIVYEIEGKQGSYYALIAGEKYKVMKFDSYSRRGVSDCEKPKYSNGTYNIHYYYYSIVYKGDTYLFNMPI